MSARIRDLTPLAIACHVSTPSDGIPPACWMKLDSRGSAFTRSSSLVFVRRSKVIENLVLDLESTTPIALDAEHIEVDEPSYPCSPLTQRTDPQLVAQGQSQLPCGLFAGPVLPNLEGEGRKSRLRPMVLETDGPVPSDKS